MELDELLFFNQYPQLQPLYEALREELLCRHPDVKVRASKTQLSFYNRHLFAMVALPLRRKKDWPKVFLQLSFGLEYRLESPTSLWRWSPIPTAGPTMCCSLAQSSWTRSFLAGWRRPTTSPSANKEAKAKARLFWRALLFHF